MNANRPSVTTPIRFVMAGCTALTQAAQSTNTLNTMCKKDDLINAACRKTTIPTVFLRLSNAGSVVAVGSRRRLRPQRQPPHRVLHDFQPIEILLLPPDEESLFLEQLFDIIEASSQDGR